jgi:hypothetical protein
MYERWNMEKNSMMKMRLESCMVTREDLLSMTIPYKDISIEEALYANGSKVKIDSPC